MKKNKIILSAMTFIMGMAVGITLFAFVSFSGSSVQKNPSQGLSVVSATDANTLFKNYYKTAIASALPLKGFFLDTLQVSAMNRIKQENSNLSGFRFYFGKDINNVPVGIVVGVNDRGSDATTNSIYKTASAGSGPCPTVCDASSTITITRN